MKNILFKRRNDLKHRIKVLSIRQQTEDAENKTFIVKNFIYKVTVVESMETKIDAPEIFIRKVCDTKNKLEKFTFRVKGSFYMPYQRYIVHVQFQHRLNIQIHWKKSFSPKKSAVLT